MIDVNVISAVQEESRKELEKNGVPPINPEGKTLNEAKRMSIDLPPTWTAVDPLR